MDVRTSGNPAVAAARRALERANARHPWSHNAHFHPWILRSLPRGSHRVLDVGCGRGDLVAALRTRVPLVDGLDADAAMARSARRRFAGLPGVRIRRAAFPEPGPAAFATPSEVGGSLVGGGGVAGESTDGDVCDGDHAEDRGRYDAITMVAVLHHLDLEPALRRAGALLRPGGRLLVVGLAPPASALDVVWDLTNALTNPLIGLVKHPRVATGATEDARMPVAEPGIPLAELRSRTEAVLPGARFRRREGFRFTMRWEKPGP